MKRKQEVSAEGSSKRRRTINDLLQEGIARLGEGKFEEALGIFDDILDDNEDRTDVLLLRFEAFASDCNDKDDWTQFDSEIKTVLLAVGGLCVRILKMSTL
jgi:hypothetical protein